MFFFFDTQDGETFIIDDIVLIGSVVSNGAGSYYDIYLSGGLHLSIKESYKTRNSLISDWESTKI